MRDDAAMSTPFSAAVDRINDGADPRGEAAALVAEMTLAEQLDCLDGDTPFWPGLFDMTEGGYYTHTWPAAVVERLGVPGIEFADGPRGAVIADGTAFPVSMARGALFDPELEEQVGDAIGTELRASGATFTGAVCMNLLRHPAWGRAQETYGEDPHHVGVMAAALARGLERHVMACMKHFALNSMENARFSLDVTADDRALHEVYLPHFRHVAEQGIASVMSAYNSLNGEWCGDNYGLLTAILRDEWGWDGFVISDFIFGLRDAVTSVQAGLDIEMPFRQQRALVLADAVADGRLATKTVTDSVERIMATLLRYAWVYAKQPDPALINCERHRALARRVASASAVLLRNAPLSTGEPLLPADPATTATVAVLGRLASRVNIGDGGSSDVKTTTAITPLDGIRDAFATSTVTHADTITDVSAPQVEAADLVVVVVGYTKADEGEYIDNSGTMALAADLFPPRNHPELGVPDRQFIESPADDSTEPPVETPDGDGPDEVGGMARGGDRSSLRLSEGDEALIAAAIAANDNVVVIVQCGSAVLMPWADSVPAVLVGWYGGVEAGPGIGDVLVGASEPGGRLPFAIPSEAEHLVPFDRDATSVTYDLFHGQWKLDADGNAAQFPFGAGFGYTTWTLEPASLGSDGATVSVAARNTGDRDGSTVVYVFGSKPDSAWERPLRRLVGFARLQAAAGASVTANVAVDWRQLDVRTPDGWLTEPGTYELTVSFDAAAAADAALLTASYDGSWVG